MEIYLHTPGEQGRVAGGGPACAQGHAHRRWHLGHGEVGFGSLVVGAPVGLRHGQQSLMQRDRLRLRILAGLCPAGRGGPPQPSTQPLHPHTHCHRPERYGRQRTRSGALEILTLLEGLLSLNRFLQTHTVDEHSMCQGIQVALVCGNVHGLCDMSQAARTPGMVVTVARCTSDASTEGSLA